MAGRPKFEVTDALCAHAENLAASGLTKGEIALHLGCCYDTLREREKEYSEFSDAIKRGKARGLATITNALFESAKRGNVTAMIFFLKNRAPDEWKDRLPEGFIGDTPEPEAIEVTIVDNRKPQPE